MWGTRKGILDIEGAKRELKNKNKKIVMEKKKKPQKGVRGKF
jgi:hypothetical protein